MFHNQLFPSFGRHIFFNSTLPSNITKPIFPSINSAHFLTTCFFPSFYSGAAIACHKFVISFSFGLEMVEEGTRRAVVALYVFTFAAMTAIGIGIGLGVSATASESKAYIASSASLQGKEGRDPNPI